MNEDDTLKTTTNLATHKFTCSDLKGAFYRIMSILRAIVSADGDDTGESWGAAPVFDDDDPKQGSAVFHGINMCGVKGALDTHVFACRRVGGGDANIELSAAGLYVVDSNGQRETYAFERVVNFQANRKKGLFSFVYDNNGTIFARTHTHIVIR